MTPAELAALHARAMRFPRPWSAAEIGDLLASPNVFLVWQANGFALGRAIADEAELLTLAVEPAARRRGLGRNLLQAFETEARTRCAARAFLEVSETNAAARRLYAVSGYAESGRRKGYYRQPDGTSVDAILMEKTLK